jgi:glucose/mannose transport system permease protein
MRTRLQNWIPKLGLAPSVAALFFFVYGFILFTIYLSFTDSTILPSYGWVGWHNYLRLFQLPMWSTALENLVIFASLYIAISIAIGLGLAILLDQKIRSEGVLRPIFLYPMALSFIVTGTAWKWLLDPGLGIQHTMQLWGWTNFRFGWIKNPHLAIYCVVIAAVWQTSGFVMAMFLAGLRGIDGEILKAAQMDGASNWSLYRRIIIPQLRPAFMSAIIILAFLAIKSYDLVVALTDGGPGWATQLPSTFMYSYTFTRDEMGTGAAAAVVMLMMTAAIMVPYLYAELKEPK